MNEVINILSICSPSSLVHHAIFSGQYVDVLLTAFRYLPGKTLSKHVSFELVLIFTVASLVTSSCERYSYKVGKSIRNRSMRKQRDCRMIPALASQAITSDQPITHTIHIQVYPILRLCYVPPTKLTAKNTINAEQDKFCITDCVT